jgi:hypothetical protein
LEKAKAKELNFISAFPVDPCLSDKAHLAGHDRGRSGGWEISRTYRILLENKRK